MNTLIEMTDLWQHRPAGDATSSVVAAWYTAKGRLHEALAAETRDQGEALVELDHAAAAYDHAHRALADQRATPAITRADVALAGGR